MSMELHVFVPPGQVINRAGWQAALDAAGAPLRLDAAFDPIEAGGYCPMVIGVRSAGCEIDLEDAPSLIDDYPLLAGQVDEAAAVYSFRFGGNMLETACACGAAAALLCHFNALAFDPQAGTLTRDPAALLMEMRACLTHA